jgi:sugar phosphate isomerase/epimerase
MPFHDLEENIDLIISYRFNVEIYFSSDCLDSCSPKEMSKVQKILEKKGILVSFHAPFMDLSPGGDDRLVREVTFKRMQQIVHLAGIFNPLVIVVHPGYDDLRYGDHVEAWIEQSAETWKRVIDSLSSNNTVIALENIFEKRPDTLHALIQSIDSPRFRYCLDTGHFNMFSEIPFEQWFDKLGSYLAEIHLHDNHGESDEHLGIGQGNFDFSLLFSLLETNDSSPLLTIEGKNKEEIIKSLNYLKVL